VAGGSVALACWLERGIRRAEGGPPPKRLMILHRPNGSVREDWIRSGQRGPILEPFAGVWAHAVALKGMSVKAGDNSSGADPHGKALTTIMTGAHLSSKTPPGSDDGRWNTAESLDQSWSRQSPVLNTPPIKSVQTGANGRMSGLQEPQNRTLSYSGPERPLYPVISPYDVYKRLFGSTVAPGGATTENTEALAKLRQRRESVLRFVKADLGRVRQQFPASAREDLDAHETAVRELESKLDTNPSATPSGCKPPLVAAGLPVGNTSNTEVAKIAAAQFAILRAAFVCDLTRTVTFMWGTGASAMSFSAFGIGDHHGTSHSANRTAMSKADRWFSEQTAPFIQSLIDTPEPGGGKLIDNTLVWYINENAEGWSHSQTDMPFVLFGGDGVGLTNRGRIADVSGTTTNDIWLSIAPLFGLPGVKSFPTAYTGPIPGLFKA
jgi:hypothetical protein